jgi:hypothetical protein
MLRPALVLTLALGALPGLDLETLPGPAEDPGYGLGDAVVDARWEVGGLFAGITLIGATSWKWGSSSFAFADEGFFGDDTGSGGMDKLGHAYSSYLIAELIAARLDDHTSPGRASAYAAVLATGLMLYVETFDGFSGDHGFAWQDLVANTTGIAFSVLRRNVPAVAEFLDYRMAYWPSGEWWRYRPLSDYNGQTYILAFKLSGFEALAGTGLDWFEIHAGYGIDDWDGRSYAPGDGSRSEAYLGIGIDLERLLVRPWSGRAPTAARWAGTGLTYIQPPFTSLPLRTWERER